MRHCKHNLPDEIHPFSRTGFGCWKQVPDGVLHLEDPSHVPGKVSKNRNAFQILAYFPRRASVDGIPVVGGNGNHFGNQKVVIKLVKNRDPSGAPCYGYACPGFQTQPAFILLSVYLIVYYSMTSFKIGQRQLSLIILYIIYHNQPIRPAVALLQSAALLFQPVLFSFNLRQLTNAQDTFIIGLG